MAEVVRDVGEERLPGADARRDLDGLGQAEVRWMRPVPERVEDERIHAGEIGEGRVGYGIAVGEVGKGPGTESQYASFLARMATYSAPL